MKKKELNNSLKLRKRVISNLQQNSVQGGTAAASDPIKITTIILTDRRICTGNETEYTCPVDTTKVTTFPPTCMDACPSV